MHDELNDFPELTQDQIERARAALTEDDPSGRSDMYFSVHNPEMALGFVLARIEAGKKRQDLFEEEDSLIIAARTQPNAMSAFDPKHVALTFISQILGDLRKAMCGPK